MINPPHLPQSQGTGGIRRDPGSRESPGAGQREDLSGLKPWPVLVALLSPEPCSAPVQTQPTPSPGSCTPPAAQAPPSYLFLYKSNFRASRSLVRSLLCCEHRKARSGVAARGRVQQADYQQP